MRLNVCQKFLDREGGQMKSESWFAKLKERIESKKNEKRKREFSFLTKVMDSNYIQLIEQMQHHENETANILCELKKNIEDISVSERQYRENMEQVLNKIEDTICDMAMCSDKVTSIINERFSLVQESIKETQDKMKDGNEEVKKVIGEVVEQVDSMRKDTQKNIALENVLIKDKTSEILSNIEDVKELMKIIAVNNLIDEI